MKIDITIAFGMSSLLFYLAVSFWLNHCANNWIITSFDIAYAVKSDGIVESW